MRRCYPAIALLAAVLAVISTIAPSVGAEPGFATPGQDEVLVLESENLQAFVRLGKKGDWCRQKANLNLYMRDDTVFGGDQRELKALLAELPDVLRSECSTLRNVGIRGFIAGKRIYKANITAINATPRTIEKILDRRIAAKYSGPVAPRAESVDAPEDQPLREETGAPLTEARNLGEQCDMLAAWTTRFFDEYPGFDVFANDVGEFEPRAANLFGDRLFVPLFGRPYDETEPAWRGQVFQQVYQRCPKKYRFTPGIGAVFKGGFSSYAARLNSETLLVKVKERREIRAWLERQLAELDGIPISAAGLERVHELATDGPARISVLWPSEQTAFTSRVVARRSQLALRLADERIAALPVDGESLRAIGAILGVTESYVIAADDTPFATLRARAEARREEIRVGLVEREITALAAYPDEVLSLAQISAQAQRLLETVGRTPPLPVFERYELARASRSVEIARATLPAFEAELALLPESFSGAEAAIAQFQSISDLLVSVVPAWAPMFESAARERTRLIHDALIDAAVARISAAAERSSNEGWRVAPRLLAIGADEASPFAGTLAKDRAAEIISATAVWEANAVAEQEIGRFRDEVSALDATWASVNELDRMAALIRRHEQAIPPLEGYGAEAAGRRAHVLDALAEMARAEIQTAGASYLDAEDILTLGERHARRFDDAGAPAKAADLRKFTATRAAAVAEAYLPAFEEELAGLEATRAKAAELESAAGDFETQANRLPPFTKYRQAALLRAAAMRETVCDFAVERAGLAPEDEQKGVLGADEPMTLRKFVCTLDEQGHQVSEFAAPGSLQVEGGYTLRVFRSDGKFVHAKLRKVEALPGQELLVGFAYGDVNQQQEIWANEWRVHTGVLLGLRSPAALSDATGSTQQKIAARLQNSAAFVMFRKEKPPYAGYGTGSGFFISPTLLVTNRHVVEGSGPNDEIRVTSVKLGKLYPGRVVAMSGVLGETANSRDYALIAFDEPLPVEPLVVASAVNELAQVITAGYPAFVTSAGRELNEQFARLERLHEQGDMTMAPDMVFTTGEVSVVQARSSGIPMIIHTALISHGNSGGPLVDMCERIIGVNTWILEDDKYTNRVSFFSISASDLISFLRQNGVDEFETTDEPCRN